MKVLFFDPEQYVQFEEEPSNYQVRLPLLNAGVVSEHRDVVYQRILHDAGPDEMNRQALAAYREFSPDVVINSLCWWPECLDWRTLATMRDGGTKVISIFWDTWIDALPHETELFLNSDLLLIMDSLSSYLRFRLLAEHHGRLDAVVFSPIAVFTDKVREMPVERDIDVLVLGSNEVQRADLAKYLDQNLSAKGIRFRRLGGLVDSDGDASQKNKDWVDWDQYVEAVNRAKICISSQTVADRYQIKGKIFDFLSCGTLCLTDRNPELDVFVPEDVFAFYSDPADCLDKAVYYVEHEAEREKIARRGQAWLEDTYDYKIFWRSILENVTGAGGALPVLPGVEEFYGGFRSNQDLVVRQHLSALNELAHLTNSGRQIKRLSVRAEGSHKGLNIFNVDERFIVTTDSLDVDFLEIDGELFAIRGGTGLVKIPDGEIVMGAQSKLFLAPNVELARQIIDQLTKT